MVETKQLPLAKRLIDTMHGKNINARELAAQAGVGQSFVYDIISGKSKNPTVQKLTSVARILDVSVLFLIYGSEVGHIAPRYDNNMISIPQLVISNIKDNKPRLRSIENQQNLFHLEWIKEQLKCEPDNLRLIQIYGDIMYPTLTDGDLVIIDISKTLPTPAGIFALFDGIGISVKRVEHLGTSSENNIRIISDNSKYEPYEISDKSLNILGRVVWMSRSI